MSEEERESKLVEQIRISRPFPGWLSGQESFTHLNIQDSRVWRLTLKTILEFNLQFNLSLHKWYFLPTGQFFIDPTEPIRSLLIPNTPKLRFTSSVPQYLRKDPNLKLFFFQTYNEYHETLRSVILQELAIGPHYDTLFRLDNGQLVFTGDFTLDLLKDHHGLSRITSFSDNLIAGMILLKRNMQVIDSFLSRSNTYGISQSSLLKMLI